MNKILRIILIILSILVGLGLIGYFSDKGIKPEIIEKRMVDEQFIANLKNPEESNILWGILISQGTDSWVVQINEKEETLSLADNMTILGYSLDNNNEIALYKNVLVALEDKILIALNQNNEIINIMKELYK